MTGPTSKILFVDDEAPFLELVKRIFGKEDYEILTAGSGDEALEVIAKNLPISVMVTDFRMPGMNGDELIKKLHDLSPQTKAIVVSAHSEAIDACRQVPEERIFCVIPKPVNFEYLKETIKSAIKHSHQSSD
ncbi:MAG: response regulator [Nitrospinae bacterium]|nr:response regulator [Nitrospinota bacterium]